MYLNNGLLRTFVQGGLVQGGRCAVGGWWLAVGVS